MKKAIILVLLLSVFALTGCGPDTNTGGATWVGGTDGLNMGFRIGSPPDYIFDNDKQPFAVIIDLENAGEYDLPANQGIVMLGGVSPASFGKTPADFAKVINFELDGKRKNFDGNILNGARNAVAFEGLRYKNDLAGNMDITFQADLCYNYKTQSTTQICIKDDVLSSTLNDICKVDEAKSPQNSGAPVQVVTVTETSAGTNSVFIYATVKPVKSDGKIFKNQASFTANSCEDSLTNLDKDKVLVTVSLPKFTNARNLKCDQLETPSGPGENSKSGYLYLYDGEGSFTCTIEGDPNGKNVYNEVLSIDLEYAYRTTALKPVTVRDASDSP